MLKSLFNWRVLLNLILAAGVFVGLIYLTFRWLEIHTHHGDEIQVPNVVNKSVHDAVKILDDSGLEYEVDSFKYDPKYRPFQVLQIYPAPGSRVKNGRSVTLKVNPRNWAPVSVPDVINKYSGLGFQRLDQVGLKVGDTIYEPSIQKDAILRILFKGNSIKPGTKIPRFSIIDVVIGSGPMRNIGIPNVVGLTVKEAKALIARNLFEVGIVDYEDGGSDENDIVYYQDPASGDVRDQGMQIDLWASKKTPAELMNKINELNSMYRMKIDTTLPPVRYEEVPNFQDVPPIETTPATPPKREVPKSDPPKQNTTPAKSSGDKPKTTTNTTKPADKPKAKQVIL